MLSSAGRLWLSVDRDDERPKLHERVPREFDVRAWSAAKLGIPLNEVPDELIRKLEPSGGAHANALTSHDRPRSHSDVALTLPPVTAQVAPPRQLTTCLPLTRPSTRPRETRKVRGCARPPISITTLCITTFS